MARRRVLMHWKQRKMARSRPNQRKREKPVLQEATRTSPEGLMPSLDHQETDDTDEVITEGPEARLCSGD